MPRSLHNLFLSEEKGSREENDQQQFTYKMLMEAWAAAAHPEAGGTNGSRFFLSFKIGERPAPR
jgi:hypothetical protein